MDPLCLGGPWTSSSRKAPLVQGASQLLSLSSEAPARLHQLASCRQARQRRILLPILAMDLASIRLGVKIVDQQLSITN
jgi:hypothetical protein